MFLQHGQTDLGPLCVHGLLWFLERYNVHVVKLGHKVFYANYVCVFMDIDQLKGKPMQNLVKNILCGSRMEHFRKLL